jgi:hypothetical protein
MVTRELRVSMRKGPISMSVERLGDIIVGAGIEARDLVAPAIACSQNQHRKLAAGLAPALENGDAVDLGQAKIEHNRVIGLRVA